MKLRWYVTTLHWWQTKSCITWNDPIAENLPAPSSVTSFVASSRTVRAAIWPVRNQPEFLFSLRSYVERRSVWKRERRFWHHCTVRFASEAATDPELTPAGFCVFSDPGRSQNYLINRTLIRSYFLFPAAWSNPGLRTTDRRPNAAREAISCL